MGYCIRQVGAKFFIAASNRANVEAAINALMLRGSERRDGKFAWVDTAAVLRAPSIHEKLEQWSWLARYDAEGNVVGLSFQAEKAGDEMALLKAIAPYVRAGSYLEMCGEEGERWRWHFDGTDCEELEADVSFAKPSKGDVIDVEVTEVSHRPALAGKPKALPPR